MPQDVAPRIVVDPAVRCGRSVIRGNEIGVADVRAALGYAASVLTAEEVRGTA